MRVWNVLRVITTFFCLIFSINFCESFIPHFKNLYYLLHLNELDDNVSEEKDLENDSSVEIRDVNTSSLGNKVSAKGNAANIFDNGLQGNFVQ